MTSKQERFRVAVLDDYQNVALSLADWSVLDGRATVAEFNDHLSDSDAVVERIRDAANFAATRRVFLGVDGIWPEWVDDSPDALDRLFQDVGSPIFGVNFDPCYLVLMGIDPAAFAKRFAKRIVHAHLKDHVGRYPNWTHLIPGRGEMDYAKVFAALCESGFSRSCSVECFTNMPFAEACDDGYRAMTSAAQKAGARFEPSPLALPAARIGHEAVPMK